MGPRGTLVVQRIGNPDSVLVGAPGRALSQPVAFRLVDGKGQPVPGASVQWSVVAGHGRIAQSDAVTRNDGTASAVWELGTQAGDSQKLAAELIVGSHRAMAEVPALAVPVEVTSLAIQSETTEVHLGVPARLTAQATDPFGNRFLPTDLRFAVLDTILAVDSTGRLAARRRGYARVVATASGHADTAVVHAIQIVAAIHVDRDTLRFHSIGQGQQVGVTLVDDQGLAVADSLPAVMASDPSIVTVQPGESLLVQSLANGVADVELQTGSVNRQVVAVVRQRTATLEFLGPAPHLDALKDTVRPTLVILDSLGVPVQSPHIAFWSGDSAVATIDSMGLITAVGNGTATLFARSASGVVASVPVAVEQVVTQFTVSQTSLQFDALNAALPAGVVARDRLGSPVTGAAVIYESADTTVAEVDASGNILARGNGTTMVSARKDSLSAAVTVTVAQRPVRVVASSDTLRFVALGDTEAVSAVAVDSLGSPVPGGVAGLTVDDTSVVRQLDSIRIRSANNGTTSARFTVGGLTGSVAVVVNQIAETISASLTVADSIVDLPLGAVIPVACEARDRNGYVLSIPPSVKSSSEGRWVGTRCDSLRIARSGFDTLRLVSGNASAAVPITLAVRPQLGFPQPLVVDSPLVGYTFWTPSARRNGHGEIEVYFSSTNGSPDSLNLVRSNLYRLVSTDGLEFHYDGLVLSHADDPCAPDGSGIENVTIVPRADGPGWRMFYSAGSGTCYGWQVFSATSPDERSWTKEPGVRLSNGGTLPPDPPSTPPWPVGEGMVTDRLPDGTWRMIVGSFEHVTSDDAKWQVVEWRSADQLAWAPLRTLVSTRQLPAEGQRAAYSPTVREFAPGLWRMIFTADDLDVGGRSRLWGAVSTDLVHWQVEGAILDDPSFNYFYSALVDDQLYTLQAPRVDVAQDTRLVRVLVSMP